MCLALISHIWRAFLYIPVTDFLTKWQSKGKAIHILKATKLALGLLGLIGLIGLMVAISWLTAGPNAAMTSRPPAKIV
jgi:hypothetical protein